MLMPMSLLGKALSELILRKLSPMPDDLRLSFDISLGIDPDRSRFSFFRTQLAVS